MRRVKSARQNSYILHRIRIGPLMSNLASPSHEVTQLLLEWNEGKADVLEKLMPLVYKELCRLARQYLNKERAGHTLLTTDLVHEAYLRLIDQKRVKWQNRAHFFGIAAQLMRRILVDHARGKKRIKRGDGTQRVSLNQVATTSYESKVDILAIDEALRRLAELDERKAKVVELRFFGGLEIEEVAEFLALSPITVSRDWKLAKAWLHRALTDES